jgi:hypothetical protein
MICAIPALSCTKTNKEVTKTGKEVSKAIDKVLGEPKKKDHTTEVRGTVLIIVDQLVHVCCMGQRAAAAWSA